MSDLTLNETLLGQLRAPSRNRYFYGKLLDVDHLDLEQDYHVLARWRLNRLALGSGVVCGLQLELTDAGLLVRPGVAIDALGREITVPGSYCVTDPLQPTDVLGGPDGDRVEHGTVAVYLCYVECPADPTPVLVGDCDSRNATAPGRTVERFRVQLVAGAPVGTRGLSEAQCDAILADAAGLPEAACRALAGACAPPDRVCVLLGTVAVDPDGTKTVQQCEVRTTLYSNERLFDLLACLAARVARCCAGTSLRYLAGDAQHGKPGAELPVRLQARVEDHDGGGVDGADVTFHVQAGAATVGDGAVSGAQVVVPSAGGGLAAATLTLGDTAGPVSVEATLQGGARIVYTAWADEQPPPVDHPPVVLTLRPAPNEVILVDDDGAGTQWAHEPQLVVTFDQEMRTDDLKRPGEWLRLWMLLEPHDGAEEVAVIPVELRLGDVAVAPVHAATYRLRLDLGEVAPSIAVLQIRSESDRIVSSTAPSLELDADFRGTPIDEDLLQRLWDTPDRAKLPVALWQQIGDTGARLPRSGDGAAGGRLSAWFRVGRR
ncbi:Ig-like domain-containing protein [Cumulibacter manganitolerans]|uniref:hypothetical protein n=1 Tax=Cumulibacter manganitolerans TaxID=1884992 RepID=UPI00129730FC|nr:hypothetical protein [Cumulibacter manganitolerans]